MVDAARSLWAEPRAPDPPAPGWRDGALVAAMLALTVVELVVGEDPVWPVASLVVIAVLVPAVVFRRVHPLAAVAAGFGACAVFTVASAVVGVDWSGFNTIAFALLLPYALFRWGSGREAALGLGVMLVPVVLDGAGPSGAGDVLAGLLILGFVSALGAVVRYEVHARRREAEQVELRGREQLARELHDTVAHHVSAIAIRAQAGRTLAGSHPGAAVDALDVIEEEASRTLDEMRTIVGALRQGEAPDLAPLPGLADIGRLATADGERPRVDVELGSDLGDLRPSVGTALFRVAQESVTNARRHARHATRVHVRVTGDPRWVRLTVRDDGDPSPGGAGSGYGLVGMAERVKLQGGTLEAGPDLDRGWTVHAVLPRSGVGP